MIIDIQIDTTNIGRTKQEQEFLTTEDLSCHVHDMRMCLEKLEDHRIIIRIF